MNTNNAVGMIFDPLVYQARMRIMKQYLPMSGSSDPSQTAEGEYYASSLALLSRIANSNEEAAKNTKEATEKL